MDGNTVAIVELPMTADSRPASVQLELLYGSYHNSINRYLYRLVGRTDLAGDLTHDVFIQLYRYLQGNTQLENPRAWLYKVATNLGYSHLRRERRLATLIQSWLPLLKSTVSPEEKYEQNEQRELARKAVGRLPIRDQILLQLFQDGLSYAEIASALGLNPASVGKLLSRAIENCAHSVVR